MVPGNVTLSNNQGSQDQRIELRDSAKDITSKRELINDIDLRVD